MQIYPEGSGPIRPETTRTSQPAGADSDAVRAITATPPCVDRFDKVSISDASRPLAARDGASDSIDPARGSQIRDRVLSGAYDTLEVVDAVARRLLDSGDL